MTSQLDEKRPLPIITCPSCGKHMRLRTIEPEPDNRDRMTFECDCGFDYHQSASATGERSL